MSARTALGGLLLAALMFALVLVCGTIGCAAHRYDAAQVATRWWPMLSARALPGDTLWAINASGSPPRWQACVIQPDSTVRFLRGTEVGPPNPHRNP